MPALPALSFCRAHGALSDPGRHAPAIDALPATLRRALRQARGLLAMGILPATIVKEPKDQVVVSVDQICRL